MGQGGKCPSVTDLPEGFRGMPPDPGVFILQGLDEGIDCSRIADIAERPGSHFSDIAIRVVQCQDEGINSRLADRAECIGSLFLDIPIRVVQCQYKRING